LKVELSGHTDNTGTREYNQELSEKRAGEVVRYLVENSIDPSRISHRGYGMEQPVASNDTEEGRAANRRTELKIISE
jgi:outer membrane protein OmpA-like peptidoglycan-associated protein